MLYVMLKVKDFLTVGILTASYFFIDVFTPSFVVLSNHTFLGTDIFL